MLQILGKEGKDGEYSGHREEVAGYTEHDHWVVNEPLHSTGQFWQKKNIFLTDIVMHKHAKMYFPINWQKIKDEKIT